MRIPRFRSATYKLAAPYAAFACFQAATSGGAFLVADGRAVLSTLPPPVLTTLLQRQLRVRVASLPLGAPIRALPAPIQAPLRSLIASIFGVGIRLALPLELDVAWSDDGTILQILEQPKPAVNRHPSSGEATFFSGVHSQSSYLQARRSGRPFDGVGATDVFYGDDLSAIDEPTLEAIDAAITDQIVRIQMVEGDVVLLDTYSVLHGRDTFVGPRQHGVLWLAHAADDADGNGDADGDDGSGGRGAGGNALSQLVNKFAVKGRTRAPPR